MTPNSLGQVLVTTSGTPVQISVTRFRACKIRIVPLPTNTKPVYVGVAGMTISTGVGVLDWAAAPSASANGSNTRVDIETHDTDRLYVDQYWIDVGNSGEGAYVSYWTE